VFLDQKDGKLYVARLPPVSEGHKGESPSQPTFTEICDMPAPHWVYLRAAGLPNSLQPRFVAKDSICVWLQEERGWNQIRPPSLPFDDIKTMAYSPCGLFIAIAIAHSYLGGNVQSIVIQIRSLPDYDLIDTLQDHLRSDWMQEFHFIEHLPHILLAASSLGFISWNAKARQSLGSCFSLSNLGSMECVRTYNGSDFLCLMKTPTALLVLVAVQLRGPDRPEVARRICYFPPHLSIASSFSVNPLHPNIVALSTRNGIIQIDISNCLLPFTL
jgi:hypothetical protein